jgi:hypothetical protein
LQRHESNLYSNPACCFYDHHDHTYHHFLTQMMSSKLSLMSKKNKKLRKKAPNYQKSLAISRLVHLSKFLLFDIDCHLSFLLITHLLNFMLFGSFPWNYLFPWTECRAIQLN